MKCILPFMALLLGSCATNTPRSEGVTALPRHVLACRSQESVATLHASGNGFQRAADAELSSGRCRRFEQGHAISGDLRNGHFTDKASGIIFYLFG